MDYISIAEVPFAYAFWLIIIEAALEESSIGVEPLALHELAILEVADVLHSSLLEDVGALAVLLALLPLTGVDVSGLLFAGVDHDSLSVALSTEPVAIVTAYSGVDLLSDSALEVLLPGALVGVLHLLGALLGVSVRALAFSVLEIIRVRTRFTISS